MNAGKCTLALLACLLFLVNEINGAPTVSYDEAEVLDPDYDYSTEPYPNSTSTVKEIKYETKPSSTATSIEGFPTLPYQSEQSTHKANGATKNNKESKKENPERESSTSTVAIKTSVESSMSVHLSEQTTQEVDAAIKSNTVTVKTILVESSPSSFLSKQNTQEASQTIKSDINHTIEDFNIFGGAVEPLSTNILLERFFRKNWKWVFLVIIAVIFLFVIPGMIVQLKCHKYYLVYRSNKKRGARKINLPETTAKDDSSSVTEFEVEDNNEESGEYELVPPQAHQSTSIAKTSDTTMEKPTEHEQNVEEAPATVPDPEPPITSTADEYQPHRQVDIYMGPPTLTLPVGTLADPPSNIYDLPPPLSPSDFPRCPTPPKNLDAQPIIARPLAVRNNHSEMSTNLTAIAIGKERILDSNSAFLHPSAARPNRRISKKKGDEPPERPPKPKLFKIRPLSVDEQQNSSDINRKPKSNQPNRKKRVRKKRVKAGATTKVVEKKPKEVEDEDPKKEDKSEKKKVKTRSTKKHPSKPRKETDDVTPMHLKELRRREALLRQIIQGINEAEMLQCKLQRTKNWTKDQKMRSHRPTSKPKQDVKKDGERQVKDHKMHMPKKRTDYPPRYEDLLVSNSDKRKRSGKHET